MNETYVAVLFRKTVINERVYGFTPITVTEGHYEEVENQFIDRMGIVHSSIKEADLVDKQEFFGFPVSLETLKEKYDTEDEKEAIEKFSADVYAVIFLGIIDTETNEMSIISVDPDGKFNEIEDMEMDFETEQAIKLVINEEGMKAMLEMETLEEVRDYLNKVMGMKKQIIDLYERQVELPQEPKIEFLKPGVNLDVKDMYSQITAKVINQDEAVRKIMMNIIEHNMTVNSEEFLKKYPNPQLTRNFITGSTGSGKTLIIESIIEYLSHNTGINIPMSKVPTSELTAAGYVGMDLEDILEELVSKVTVLKDKEAKIKYAEKNGIVFLDEIDKKGTRNNGDVSGKAVLNSLLQFIDGASYQIFKPKGLVMGENSPSSYFNTKYLNIFAAGAFMDVRTSDKKTCIGGFGGIKEEKKESLTLADYIEKGCMPPEFMGRFHQIVSLNTLSEEDLKKILTSSTISPILIEQIKKQEAGLHLSWDDSFVEAVAKEAYKLKTGARSLKAIIEKTLFEAKWDFMYNGGFSEVELTGKTVENPKVYTKK